MELPEYIQVVADLLNQESNSKRRIQRVRDANRALFLALNGGTIADADLALAAADSLERVRQVA